MWQTPGKSQLEQPFVFQKLFSSLLPGSLNEVGGKPLTVKTFSYFSSISLEWCSAAQSRASASRRESGCRLSEVIPSQSSKVDEKKPPQMRNKYADQYICRSQSLPLCIGMINAMTKDSVENLTRLLFIIYSLYHLNHCRTDSSFLGSREKTFPAKRDLTA